MWGPFFLLKWQFSWTYMNWAIKGRYAVYIKEIEEGEIWFPQAVLGLQYEFKLMSG